MGKTIVGFFSGAGYASPMNTSKSATLDLSAGLIKQSIVSESLLGATESYFFDDYRAYPGGLEEPMDYLFNNIQNAYELLEETGRKEKIKVILFAHAQGCLSAYRLIQKINADPKLRDAVEIIGDFRNPASEATIKNRPAPESSRFLDLSRCSNVREAHFTVQQQAVPNTTAVLEIPRFHPDTSLQVEVLPGAHDIQQTIVSGDSKISASNKQIIDPTTQQLMRDFDIFLLGYLKALQHLKNANVPIVSVLPHIIDTDAVNNLQDLESRQIQLYQSILNAHQTNPPALTRKLDAGGGEFQCTSTPSEATTLNARHAFLADAPNSTSLFQFVAAGNQLRSDIAYGFQPHDSKSQPAATVTPARNSETKSVPEDNAYQTELESLCKDYLRHLLSKIPENTLARYKDEKTEEDFAIEYNSEETAVDYRKPCQEDFKSQEFNYDKYRLVLELLYLIKKNRFVEAYEKIQTDHFKNVILHHDSTLVNRTSFFAPEANRFYQKLSTALERFAPAAKVTFSPTYDFEEAKIRLRGRCQLYLSHLISKLPEETLKGIETKEDDSPYSAIFHSKKSKSIFSVDSLKLSEAHFGSSQHFNFMKAQSVVTLLNCVQHGAWEDFYKTVTSEAFKKQILSHASSFQPGTTEAKKFYTALLDEANAMRPTRSYQSKSAL